MSQSELAKAVGVLRTSITNIEAGRQHPPLRVLYELCETLDMEICSLLPKREELTRPAMVSVQIDGSTKEMPPKTAALLQQLISERKGNL